MTDSIVLECPHCGDNIVVYKKELNCRIFRHGVVKATMGQINPHAKEEECVYLARNGLIYGCGKPFRVNEEMRAEVCGYI